MGRWKPPVRPVLTIAGLVAAAALVIKGLQTLSTGGWALILVAVAVLAAIILRQTRFRD